MLENIINFIFPNYCGICGEKINERYTCEKCLNILEYYQGSLYFNTSLNKYFDKLICAFAYKGVLKSLMLKFKFYNKKYISRTIGDILSRKIKEYNIKADIIIPVPISKSRLYERGYNQSELISKFISKLTGIKIKEKILFKVKNNLRQSDLSLNERISNVKDAYKIKNINEIKNKRIILVDDIFTTGSTINECSKLLKQGGAKEVIALTLLYSSK